MTAYLSRLTDSPGFNRLAGLKPEPLCPYLYYTISPYVYTIANGGWFSWIKRTQNPVDRGPAVIKNPASKKTNRQFINEVVVRCPNPDSAVIAGIGPWENDAVAVRVLYNGNGCPHHHVPGQQIILENNSARQSLQYSRLFPETLLQAMTDLPLGKALALFDQGRAGSITPFTIINPCRYHTGPVAYDSRCLLPGNCCPHVLQHIYPDVLAAMYDADVDPALTIQHPGYDGDMTLKIKKEPVERPRLINRLADKFYRLSDRLSHPLERLDYTLSISVISSRTAAGCAMREGGRYIVNLHSADFLCPAGFHAVYPYLLLAAAGEKMNWCGGLTENLIPCPDCAGTVYGIRNHPDP